MKNRNTLRECISLVEFVQWLCAFKPKWNMIFHRDQYWDLFVTIDCCKKNLLIITIFLLVTGKVNQNDMTKGRCCGMRTAISFLLKNFCRLRLVILENIDYVLYTKNVNNGNIWGIKVVVTVPVVHFFPWVSRTYLKINCQPFMAIGHSQSKFSKKAGEGSAEWWK